MKTAKEIVSEYPSCFPDGLAGELMSVDDAIKAVDSVMPKLIELYEDEELPTEEVLCVNALNKTVVGTIRLSQSGFFMCDDRFGNSHMNIIGYFKLPDLP
jgi:hypothetical protein